MAPRGHGPWPMWPTQQEPKIEQKNCFSPTGQPSRIVIQELAKLLNSSGAASHELADMLERLEMGSAKVHPNLHKKVCEIMIDDAWEAPDRVVKVQWVGHTVRSVPYPYLRGID